MRHRVRLSASALLLALGAACGSLILTGASTASASTPGTPHASPLPRLGAPGPRAAGAHHFTGSLASHAAGVSNGFLSVFQTIPNETVALSVNGQFQGDLLPGQFILGLIAAGNYMLTATPVGGGTPATGVVSVPEGANITTVIGYNVAGGPAVQSFTNDFAAPPLGSSRLALANITQGQPINIDDNGVKLNSTPLLNGGSSQTVTLPSGPVNLTVVTTSGRFLYGLGARFLLPGLLVNVFATGSQSFDQNGNVTLLTNAIPLNVGYRLYASDGGVFAFGDASFQGSLGNLKLNAPIVGGAPQSTGIGYWMTASDGGVFAFQAGFYGSMGGQHLNKPIVGMASTPDDGGYWLVASDGGIFAFGDAGFYGSTGNIPLNKPIVGMASTPDGGGYWLVASDGGIFAFGDAKFLGSEGGQPLNKPVVGMTPTVDGKGYSLVATDGGVFSFGNAQFYGSTGNITLNKPIVSIVPTSDSQGYWLVASDGGVFSYGNAAFWGSLGAITLNKPIVLGTPPGQALPGADPPGGLTIPGA